MKLRYHKIKNIPLEICTAESMIAYNLASRYCDLFLQSYNELEYNFEKSFAIYHIYNYIMSLYTPNEKYNLDAIGCCLRYGLQNYMDKNTPILCDYKSIGEIFKSNYL